MRKTSCPHSVDSPQVKVEQHCEHTFALAVIAGKKSGAWSWPCVNTNHLVSV